VITIFIRVKPGSRHDSVEAEAGGRLTVRIKARPVKGAANKYLVEFLAGCFHLKKSDVILESGLSGPYKRLSLNMSREAYDAAIAGIIDPFRRDL
jgi:uncharacterized protein